MKKKPSPSDRLDWLNLLLVEDIGPEVLRSRDPKKLIPPLHGALLKNEQDVHLFERLAFLNRREQGGEAPGLNPPPPPAGGGRAAAEAPSGRPQPMHPHPPPPVRCGA